MVKHIEGLHLWKVRTSHPTPDNGTLLITTYRKDAGIAVHKAKQFVRRKLKQNWIEVNIHSINYEGTLDA